MFEDTMLSGAFKSFEHQHFFSENQGLTKMRDVFTYRAPLGPLGFIAERLFLTRYMTKFLTERNTTLKNLAEGSDWQRFISKD